MVLYTQFIRLIEKHAETLTETWVKDILESPLAPGFARIPRKELHDVVYDRFRKLGAWIEEGNEAHERDIAEYFIGIGDHWAEKGLKASEAVYALMLERNILWQHILDDGMIADGIDLNRAIEFSRRINRFYETAAYFATVGHENHKAEAPVTREEGFFDKVFEGFKHWLIIE